MVCFFMLSWLIFKCSETAEFPVWPPPHLTQLLFRYFPQSRLNELLFVVRTVPNQSDRMTPGEVRFGLKARPHRSKRYPRCKGLPISR